MLLHVYQLICVLLVLLIAAVMLRSRSTAEQLTGAVVIVPLLLRIFLVK
jgi:ABC-type molybdate transport system permease subunit